MPKRSPLPLKQPDRSLGAAVSQREKEAADSALFSQPQSALTEAKHAENPDRDGRAATRHQREGIWEMWS